MTKAKNILFILTDQQRFDSLGCNGCSYAKTPNLDRLAAEGSNFKNHFVANPVCCPSRGAIWSGTYPSRNGLWANGGTLAEDTETIPQIFNQNGFQTTHFGKFHLEPILNRVDPHPNYGFELCEVAEGDQQYPPHDAYFNWFRRKAPLKFAEYLAEVYSRGQGDGYKSKLPEALHMSTWLTGRAEDWLTNQRDPEKPFFLSLGYFDPHHAFNPVEPYASVFDEVEIPLPPDDEAYFEGKPEHFRQRSQATRSICHDPKRMNAVQKAYHGMVNHIDTCMGHLFDTLKTLGLDENTIIVFSSDHGELLGDHGMLWKGPFMTDSLLRVPMIISGPNIPVKEVEDLSASVDFYSTLPRLAGIEASDLKEGFPMLNASGQLFNQGQHSEVYTEWDEGSTKETRTVRCLRGPRYKLVEYVGYELGEFYDLNSDPGELHNLYHLEDPKIQSEKNRMIQLLWEKYHQERPEAVLSPGW